MADEFPIGKWVNYNGAITYATNVRTTAENLDIYISANGSDSGSGSISSPYKTLAKVKEVIDSFSYLDQVRIYFMTAGTYVSNIEWNGLNFIGNRSRPGRLAFIAWESTRTILHSGTVTAGSGQTLLNTSSLGGINNFMRKFLVRKNSDGTVIDERIITANSDNSILPSHGFSTVPKVGEIFEIVQPAVVMSGNTYFLNFAGQVGLITTTYAAQVSGVFLVNMEVGNAVFVNSAAYLKEVFHFWTGASISVREKSKVLCGIASTFPTYYNLKSLSFLGAPSDSAWIGAGINADRVDAPLDTGAVIDGFFGSCWFYASASAGDYGGTLIIRGGCLNGNNATGPAINCGISRANLVMNSASDNSLEAGNPSLIIPLQITITVGNAIEVRGNSNVFIANAKISCPGHVIVVSRGATVTIDNATRLTGVTTNLANCAYVAYEGGRIIHKGNPLILGGTGGGADNRLTEGTPVSQPNSFFNTIGAAIGPSPTGAMIIRGSG